MILGNLLLTSRLKHITIYSAAELKYSIMLLKKGTLLQGGKYKIEKVLGQGGFGITYLATQINLNRKVAIKEFFMKDMCCREEDTNQVYYSPLTEILLIISKTNSLKRLRQYLLLIIVI